MKKTTLKMRRQKSEHEKKDDDSLPQKNVPYHDDRFIHRCQVRLCEDNQLYMLPSIGLLTIKKILFFYTFTHAGLARKRKRKKNGTATLRFQR